MRTVKEAISEYYILHYISLYTTDELIPGFLCKVIAALGAILTTDQEIVSVLCCTNFLKRLTFNQR